MKRSIKEKEFERYYEVLAKGLTNASHQSSLYWTASKLSEEYFKEVNQSRVFWGIVLESLETSSVLTLSKVYDKNGQAFHLQKFLIFIEKNLHIFNEEVFIKQV